MTVCVVLVPVATFPKAMVAGVAESWSVCARPVPAMGMTSGEPGALLANVRLPEKVLAEAGVKPREKVKEDAGAMERGTVRPDKVKAVPARAAWVMVRVDVPVFLMVKARELLEPTMMFPNAALAGDIEISG